MGQVTDFLSPEKHRGVLTTEKYHFLPDEQARYHACGVEALKTGNVATAYLCFSHIDRDCPTVLFNLSLCYFQIEEYENALDVLQIARRKLSVLVIPQTDRPAAMALEHLEAKEGSYLHPMEEAFAAFFPIRANHQMMRVQADILYALDRPQELQSILSALAGKGFENVERIRRELEYQ